MGRTQPKASERPPALSKPASTMSDVRHLLMDAVIVDSRRPHYIRGYARSLRIPPPLHSDVAASAGTGGCFAARCTSRHALGGAGPGLGSALVYDAEHRVVVDDGLDLVQRRISVEAEVEAGLLCRGLGAAAFGGAA